MAATARKLEYKEGDVAGGGGGAYAEIETPSDHLFTCTDVNDHTSDNGKGWVWTFELETDSGATLEFKSWTMFSPASRWKLVQLKEAFGDDVEVGVEEMDPNSYIGDTLWGTVDFPRDKETGDPTSKFREIVYFIPALPGEPSAVLTDIGEEDPEVL
jgi:hypothetical protein